MPAYNNQIPVPSLAPGQIGYSFGSQQLVGAPIAATIAASPSGAVRATNVVTITTSAAHGFSKGQLVTIAVTTVVGATSFNGTFAIASVPSTTTFTYLQTAADDTGGGGTAICNSNVQIEPGSFPINNTAGQQFALAAREQPVPRSITYFHYYNVAPTAISVSLQGAAQDIDSAYVTIDTDTTAAGNTKTIAGVLMPFLRLKITGLTVGSAQGMTAGIQV